MAAAVAHGMPFRHAKPILMGLRQMASNALLTMAFPQVFTHVTQAPRSLTRVHRVNEAKHPASVVNGCLTDVVRAAEDSTGKKKSSRNMLVNGITAFIIST
eukprot:gb/GEZJ01006826.1/.p2 GENE.gb/GEZJ01006826.1/~~gb/GEZJ01006826.1/.p2  ORF type:complete len:101 (+),score=7.30 gb/GEZJ01006826.1/:477-779(+)